MQVLRLNCFMIQYCLPTRQNGRISIEEYLTGTGGNQNELHVELSSLQASACYCIGYDDDEYEPPQSSWSMVIRTGWENCATSLEEILAEQTDLSDHAIAVIIDTFEEMLADDRKLNPSSN